MTVGLHLLQPKSLRMTSPFEEQEKEWQERKIYFLARELWLRKDKPAPSGKLWRDVFENHAGMSIEEYAKHAQSLNLKEKYERDTN